MSRKVFNKVITLVLVIFLGLGLVSCGSADVVTTSNLYMHHEIGDEPFFMVPKGRSVEVLEDYGTHILATYDGQTGILYKVYLNFDGESSLSSSNKNGKTYMVTRQNTLVYSEPADNSNVITEFESGSVLLIVPLSERWFKVIIDKNLFGYAERESFYGNRTPESDTDWVSFTYGSSKAITVKDITVYDEKGHPVSLQGGQALDVVSSKDDYIKVRLESGLTARVYKSVVANGDVSFPMDVVAMKDLYVHKTSSLESANVGAIGRGAVVTISGAVKTGNGWMLSLAEGGFVYAGYTRPAN